MDTKSEKPKKTSKRESNLKIQKDELKKPAPKLKSPKRGLSNLKERNTKLSKYISRLKKDKKRMLIGPLLDKFELPRYDLLPLIMPVSIPQVSDARIIVQTINPPSMPLEPGMLPKQDFKFKVNIPEVPHGDRRTKEINLSYGGRFDQTIGSVIGQAFENALNKHQHAHLGDIDHPKNFIINVFGTPTERQLDQIKINERVGDVVSRIKRLKEQSVAFGDQVQSKLKFLEFLLSKYQQVKLDYVVN